MTGGSRRFLESWADYGLILLILLLSVWLHWTLHAYAFDDAYIHFRIAERFLEHGAPYYNPGEAVMSSSSAVWTLVLTLVFLVATPSPAWVAAINSVVLTAGAVAFCALAFELRGDRMGRGVCWLFALPYLALVHGSSVGLMETPLAMLVVGVALRLEARDRPEAFGLFALAVFLRLELGVFLVLFSASRLQFDRKGLGRRAAWAGIVTLPLVVYDLYYFGTLIPHAVLAKSVVYSLSPAASLVLLLRHLGLVALVEKPVLLMIAATAVLYLTVLCTRAERNRGGLREGRNHILYLTAAGGALVGLTYVLSNGLIFPWYVPIIFVPLVFALFVTAAGSRSRATQITLALVIMIPAAWRLGESLVASSGRHEHFQYFEENARSRQFVAVGKKLFLEYPQARLMSSEIGGLGYGFEGTILDAAGLLTPEALKHHPMQVPEQRAAGFIGAIPAAMVVETRPELIVGLDVFLEDLMNAEILNEYRRSEAQIYLEEDRPTGTRDNLWWSRGLNIFIRSDLLDSEGGPPC